MVQDSRGPARDRAFHALQRLRENRGRQGEVLVALAPDKTYTIALINIMAAEVFGLNPVTLTDSRLTQDQIPHTLAKYLADAMSRPEQALRDTLPLLEIQGTQNQPTRAFSVDMRVDEPAGKNVVWYYFTLIEVTAWLNLQEEVMNARRLESIGTLASGIAHDFNNLITVLLGYSDELIEGSPPDSRLRIAADEVRRAAERASGLTQQLLAFSRRQRTESKEVDVNHVIADMEHMIRRLIGADIKLAFSLDPELATINADSQQIAQVLINLIVNARDAMPNGGTLRIDTENVELGDEHVDVIPGPHVAVTVTDTGVGMTPEVRQRLFEPFFTTKASGQGTGLGMSMALATVRQAGGHITVDSAPGSGTTIHLYFPRHTEAAAVPAPPVEQTSTPAVKGQGVVLLAEDDRAVRRLAVAELSRRGFTVLEAEDGMEALDLFSREKDRVDVLVTDVVMPKMNGADLARQAERLRPGVKVLFVSGHPERAGAGVDPAAVTNLLMKPFTADTLAARIRDLITGPKDFDGRIA